MTFETLTLIEDNDTQIEHSDAQNFVTRELTKIFLTIRNHEMWLYLAWNDIKARYRRTIIGPFWLVIVNAVTILGMAAIWSIIFKTNIRETFPNIAAGMICWGLIATTINEAGLTFTQYGSIIQNLPIPVYLHPLRLISRNFITFAHNFLIYIVVAACFPVPINMYTLLFLPFLTLVLVNFFFISFILGLIGARYRDFPQLLIAVMSVWIYVTPVMWDSKMLGEHYLIAYLNPLTHVINVIKMPLLGQFPDVLSIYCVFVFTIINFCLMMYIANKYSHRIPYWV